MGDFDPSPTIVRALGGANDRYIVLSKADLSRALRAYVDRVLDAGEATAGLRTWRARRQYGIVLPVTIVYFALAVFVEPLERHGLAAVA